MLRALTIATALAVTACASAPMTEAPAAQEAVIADVATVSSPQYGARVTSPFIVRGVAPANWFFENQFPVRLINAQGREIAAAPAHPRTNWLEPGPKEFSATLAFEGSGPATLILEEDMPGEGETPRQVRVELILSRD